MKDLQFLLHNMFWHLDILLSIYSRFTFYNFLHESIVWKLSRFCIPALCQRLGEIASPFKSVSNIFVLLFDSFCGIRFSISWKDINHLIYSSAYLSLKVKKCWEYLKVRLDFFFVLHAFITLESYGIGYLAHRKGNAMDNIAFLLIDSIRSCVITVLYVERTH